MLVYVDSDVPEGMTLREWRAAKDREVGPRFTWRTFLKGLLGGGWKL